MLSINPAIAANIKALDEDDLNQMLFNIEQMDAMVGSDPVAFAPVASVLPDQIEALEHKVWVAVRATIEAYVIGMGAGAVADIASESVPGSSLNVWCKHGRVRLYHRDGLAGDCEIIYGGFGFRNRNLAQRHNLKMRQELREGADAVNNALVDYAANSLGLDLSCFDGEINVRC